MSPSGVRLSIRRNVAAVEQADVDLTGCSARPSARSFAAIQASGAVCPADRPPLPPPRCAGLPRSSRPPRHRPPRRRRRSRPGWPPPSRQSRSKMANPFLHRAQRVPKAAARRSRPFRSRPPAPPRPGSDRPISAALASRCSITVCDSAWACSASLAVRRNTVPPTVGRAGARLAAARGVRAPDARRSPESSCWSRAVAAPCAQWLRVRVNMRLTRLAPPVRRGESHGQVSRPLPMWRATLFFSVFCRGSDAPVRCGFFPPSCSGRCRFAAQGIIPDRFGVDHPRRRLPRKRSAPLFDTTLSACEAACRADPDCAGFTYNGRQRAPVSRNPRCPIPVAYDNALSGEFFSRRPRGSGPARRPARGTRLFFFPPPPPSTSGI